MNTRHRPAAALSHARARGRQLWLAVLLCALCATAILAGALGAYAQSAGPAGRTGAVVQDPRTGLVYVAQPVSNAVFVFRGAGMRLLTILRVPPSPSALAVDAPRHRLYVASDTAGMLTVFDVRTYKVSRILPVGGAPAGLALADRATRLLITDRVDGSVRGLSLKGSGNVPQELFSVGPAAAHTILLAPRSVARGRQALVWGQGFQPREPVGILWQTHSLARVTADGAGSVLARFPVPRRGDLGENLIILYGERSTTTESVLLNILPAPPAPPRRLRPARPGTPLWQRVLAPSIDVPLPAAVAPTHARVLVSGSVHGHVKGGQRSARPVGRHIRAPIIALVGALVIVLVLAFVARRRLTRRRRARREARAATGKGTGRRAPAPLKKAS